MAKISRQATNDFCPQTLFLYGTYKEDKTPDFGLFCWFSYCWDGELADETIPVGERLRRIAPISTTCSTYFSYIGEALAHGVSPEKRF